MRKTARKLHLHRETVRQLNRETLGGVPLAGGTNNRTCIPDTYYCPTGPAVCDTTVLRC